MQKSRLLWGALLGGLTSLALTAIFYAGEQLAGLPFLPFDLFDWLGRVLPGPVITAGIDTIVTVVRAIDVGSTSDSSKLAEQLIALAQFTAIGVVVGVVIAAIVQRTARRGWLLGGVVGAVLFLLFAAIELNLGFISGAVDYGWIALLTLAWGALLGAVLDQPQAVEVAGEAEGESRVAPDRRRFLGAAAGSLAVALIGWAARALATGDTTHNGAGRQRAGRGRRLAVGRGDAAESA